MGGLLGGGGGRGGKGYVAPPPLKDLALSQTIPKMKVVSNSHREFIVCHFVKASF